MSKEYIFDSINGPLEFFEDCKDEKRVYLDATVYQKIIELLIEQEKHETDPATRKNLRNIINQMARPVIEIDLEQMERATAGEIIEAEGVVFIGEEIRRKIIQATSKDEIKQLLAIKDSNTGIATNTPFFKRLQKRQGEQRNKAEVIRLFQDNDFTIKNGGLTVFQKGAFDVLARAFWEGRITSENMIVLEKGQAGRWFTGCTGTPGTEAMEDFLDALHDMRNQPLNYSTTAELADIIGLEAATLADSIPGLKQTGTAYEMNEHILDKVDIIKGRYKRRGQPVDVYLVKMGNITLKLLQAMPWYEERPQDFFQVKYWHDGKLKRLGYSKKRKTLQTYIFDEVFSKQRANDSRGGRSYYADMLPYEKIFSACGLDVSHGTERKNRVEDVKRIFEHLLIEGEIYAFSEYDTKRQKAAGIKYQLGAEQYTVEG